MIKVKICFCKKLKEAKESKKKRKEAKKSKIKAEKARQNYQNGKKDTIFHIVNIIIPCTITSSTAYE